MPRKALETPTHYERPYRPLPVALLNAGARAVDRFLEYLDVLLTVFPEATVVQTHRDPQKSVVSFCSMVAHGRGIFSDRCASTCAS